MINQTLSHYKVIELLGRGGMGEVYRATDTKLGRDVALKILPREFSEDPERRARFEREARTLATLQHPNVASVYGFEEHEGTRFLVMELAQGEELTQRITRGLSIEDAVSIASQIALGLEAAHDNGIVHRDLKPANVQIAADGSVKLLDFGLARAWDEDGAAPDPLNSPTITGNMTAHGAIMGTAAYMSPEQARGKAVDRQADVWAFGCVLFEMLSGRSAYAGDTITDTLAAIIHKEPNWEELPQNTPAHLRRLLVLCLQKSPADRLRDARDIRLLLAAPAEEESGQQPQATSSTRPNRLWPAIAAVLAVALVAALIFGRSKSSTVQSSQDDALRITAMEQLTDRVGLERDPSLSPDARMLLYAARDDGDLDIFLQRVGGEKPINLTADHGGDDQQPAFSPDGERVAFSSSREGGGTFVMGATGETPLRVADFGFDPAWSPDGRSLVVTEELVTRAYSRSGLSNLWIIDLESRNKRRLDDIDAVGASWSPSGHRIAFWTHLETVRGQRDIYTIAAEGGEPKPVTLDAATDWDPVWSPDGRWLYFLSDRGGSPDLWRQRIEEQSGDTVGNPQAVTAGMSRLIQVSIAGNGQLALTSEASGSEFQSVPFDFEMLRVTGTPTTLLTSSNTLLQIDTSADGWIAYRTSAPAEHLYVMRSDGSARRRIVATADRNRGPMFMPGSDWITFYSNRSKVYQLWAIRRDGSGLKQLSNNPEQDITGPMVSADGRIFATYEAPNKFMGELKLPAGGIDALDTPIEMTNMHEDVEITPNAISMDGRMMAGMHREDGTPVIHLMETGELDRLTLEDEPLAATGDGFTWLDNRRLLFWNPRRQSAMVWDVELRSATVVETLPGPAHYSVLPQQQALLVNLQKENSEIWLVTMETSP